MFISIKTPGQRKLDSIKVDTNDASHLELKNTGDLKLVFDAFQTKKLNVLVQLNQKQHCAAFGEFVIKQPKSVSNPE